MWCSSISRAACSTVASGAIEITLRVITSRAFMGASSLGHVERYETTPPPKPH